MMRGFKYYGAPMTQNECYSNIIAPGSTRKGGRYGPCPLFNGTSKLPAVQSNGIFPDDPDAVDMVNVDEFYDKSAADFVREAHGRGQPFFWYACGPNTLWNQKWNCVISRARAVDLSSMPPGHGRYFASHHTHAPQFAPCQTADDSRGEDGLASNCSSPRGLFGDSLGLLDRSVGRMHMLLHELGIENNTLTIFSADNGGSLHWGILGGTNGDLRCGKGTLWEGQ
jgi:arylsulfatase A-like enzyme